MFIVGEFIHINYPLCQIMTTINYFIHSRQNKKYFYICILHTILKQTQNNIIISLISCSKETTHS